MKPWKSSYHWKVDVKDLGKKIFQGEASNQIISVGVYAEEFRLVDL